MKAERRERENGKEKVIKSFYGIFHPSIEVSKLRLSPNGKYLAFQVVKSFYGELVDSPKFYVLDLEKNKIAFKKDLVYRNDIHWNSKSTKLYIGAYSPDKQNSGIYYQEF